MEKKRVFISSKIEIEHINTTDQEFTVLAKINLFWKDEICLDQERESRKWENLANHPIEPKWKTFGTYNKDNKWHQVPFEFLKNRDRNIDLLWNKYKESERKGDYPPSKFYLPLIGSASWGSLEKSFETAKPDQINTLNEMGHPFTLMAREIQDDETECFYWQSVVFRATFDQFFEMKQFPFDKQILNINFLCYSKKFEIVKYLPQELRGDWLVEQWGMEKAVKCRKIDTVWTSEWSLMKPELDQILESRKSTRSESQLISIPLRVERRPMHYQLYSLFPIFLVTSCNFATFWLQDDEDQQKEFQNRLSLILTTLLTVTASQLSSVEGLPNLPTTTIIDKYIAGSFLMTVSFIPFTIVSNGMDDVEQKQRFELLCIEVLAALWCLFSIFYAAGAVRFKAWKFCCCLGVLHHSWEDRAKSENKRRNFEKNDDIGWKETNDAAANTF